MKKIEGDVISLIVGYFECLDGIRDDERSNRISSATGGYLLKDFTDSEWFCFLLGLRKGMEWEWQKNVNK